MIMDHELADPAPALYGRHRWRKRRFCRSKNLPVHTPQGGTEILNVTLEIAPAFPGYRPSMGIKKPQTGYSLRLL